MRLIIRAVIACICAVLLSFPGVSAAVYPGRVITMIIAYVPGGGPDVVARALAPYLEKHLGAGAKIVVVNRTGAGGEIGFTLFCEALADGNTNPFIHSPLIHTT